MPALPFIFISGYTEDVAAQAGAVASGSFLQKPFTSAALAAAVHDALARAGDMHEIST